MGIGTIWSTVKAKVAAGVVAAVAIVGTFGLVLVNVPGHEGQYGLYNPATRDTLWALDSADLDRKYDSLVDIGHIVVNPGDYVYGCPSRGDRGAILNGYIVDYIDPADEGWHNSIAAKQRELHRALTPAEMEDLLFPVDAMEVQPDGSLKKIPGSGKMRKAYVPIRARRGNELALKLKAATVPTDTNTRAVNYRIKSGFIDFQALERAANIPGLRDKAASPDIMGVLDGDKIPASVIRLAGTDTAAVIKDAKSKTPESALDYHVISSGDVTIGTSGTYLNPALLCSDLATTFTGNITGTIISGYAMTSAATCAANQGGYTLAIQQHTNGFHNGNFVDGYIGTMNSGTDAMIYLQNTNGAFVANGLSCKRITTAPAAGRAFLWLAGTSMVYRISNCVFNGNGLVNVRSVYMPSGTGSGSYIVNCMANYSNYAIDVGVGGVVIENNTLFHSTGSYGFYCTGSAACTFRNNVAIGYSTDYGQISASTGRNNASSGSTAGDANWAAGSGNQTNINTGNEFVTIDAALTQCGRLKNAGVLWNSGATPANAGSVDLAKRPRPGRGGGYAIGAFEYHWLSASNLVGIAPNYANGDSTIPLPDTTGDQLVFWCTGDSVKAGKYLNLIGNDTGSATAGAYEVDSGAVGSCLYFNGSDSVVWADAAKYRLSGQFTLMSWLKIPNATEAGGLFGNHNNTDTSGVTMSWQMGGSDRLSIYGKSGTAGGRSSNTIFTDIGWTHSATINRSDSVVFYRNALHAGSNVPMTLKPSINSWVMGAMAPYSLTTYRLIGFMGPTVAADTAISLIKLNTYRISDRKIPGVIDTTATGLVYVDTAGALVDTVWFAINDTTTWRKYPVESDNVYDISPYLPNNGNWSLKWKGTNSTNGYRHEAQSGTMISTYAGRIAKSYSAAVKYVFVQGGQSNLLDGQSTATIYGHWANFLDSLSDFISNPNCVVLHIGMPKSTSTIYNDSMVFLDALLASKADSLANAFRASFKYRFLPGPYNIELVEADPWHPSKTGYHKWLSILRDAMIFHVHNSQDSAIVGGQSLLMPRGENFGFQFTLDSLGSTITANRVYCRSSNDMGVSGVTVSQVCVAVPPVIVSINPSTGPPSGNTAVTITGLNFGDSATVFFGDSLPVSYSLRTDTEIRCVTKKHPAGLVNVIVISQNQQSDTLVSGFRYRSRINDDRMGLGIGIGF